ncbi:MULTISPECIES: sulfurtransferase TusA family protein [Brevundimonas]|uniref:sulfurtransferase TusA family protein n=1 Tax=Brevundimonas TaxID=41275 RepID=UPI000F036FEB|nr:sulfurtransferase TusA family protein [Brevundimonas lutea]
MSETKVDARGHRCPVPTLRLRKALSLAMPGETVILLATDPMARIDAPHLAAQLGAEVIGVTETDGVLTITVRTDAKTG